VSLHLFSDPSELSLRGCDLEMNMNVKNMTIAKQRRFSSSSQTLAEFVDNNSVISISGV
jgi:hypothetical protein